MRFVVIMEHEGIRKVWSDPHSREWCESEARHKNEFSTQFGYGTRFTVETYGVAR